MTTLNHEQLNQVELLYKHYKKTEKKLLGY